MIYFYSTQYFERTMFLKSHTRISIGVGGYCEW